MVHVYIYGIWYIWYMHTYLYEDGNLKDERVAAGGALDHGVHVPGGSLARVVGRGRLDDHGHGHDHDEDKDDNEDDNYNDEKDNDDDDLNFVHHLPEDGIEATIKGPCEGGRESLDDHCHRHCHRKNHHFHRRHHNQVKRHLNSDNRL